MHTDEIIPFGSPFTQPFYDSPQTPGCPSFEDHNVILEEVEEPNADIGEFLIGCSHLKLIHQRCWILMIFLLILLHNQTKQQTKILYSHLKKQHNKPDLNYINRLNNFPRVLFPVYQPKSLNPNHLYIQHKLSTYKTPANNSRAHWIKIGVLQFHNSNNNHFLRSKFNNTKTSLYLNSNFHNSWIHNIVWLQETSQFHPHKIIYCKFHQCNQFRNSEATNFLIQNRKVNTFSLNRDDFKCISKWPCVTINNFYNWILSTNSLFHFIPPHKLA